MIWDEKALSQGLLSATLSYPRRHPASFTPEAGDRVRTATYALLLRSALTTRSLHSRASRPLGMARSPQPPSPQPRQRGAARAATFPIARARRAHQTCSTFSLPPHAVTLSASKHPGPSGPAQVAITTGRNSRTYTKPERLSGHAAPGRAPRPGLTARGQKASRRSPGAQSVLTMSGMVRSSRSCSDLPPALCAPRPPEDAAWARLSCHK